MDIENQGEMARSSIRSLIAAPRGQGGTMPAAGAPSLSIHNHQASAPRPTSSTPRRTVPPFKARRDRRDRTTLLGSYVFAPPSHLLYTRDVPFSPWCPTMHYILLKNNGVSLPNHDDGPSNHTAFAVYLHNLTPYNCARTDSTAIGENPCPKSHPDIGNPTICSETYSHRKICYTNSWKGAVP